MKTIVAVFSVMLFAGCCKVYCDGTDLGLGFQKFKAKDTDTVLFVKYLPGSAQTKPVDTSRILYRVAPTDTTHSSVVYQISSGYDWKVLLPSVNRQFVFESFELTTEKCNCGGKYKAIKSFLLNGVRKEGLFVALE